MKAVDEGGWSWRGRPLVTTNELGIGTDDGLSHGNQHMQSN